MTPLVAGVDPSKYLRTHFSSRGMRTELLLHPSSIDCINNLLPNILATQRLPVGNLLFTFYATAMLWLHRGQRKPQNQRETIKKDTDSYFKDFILPGRYAITVLNLHSLCNNSYDATHNFFINHSYPVEK